MCAARKPVWRQLRAEAMAGLQGSVYAPLSHGNVRVALSRGRLLGWGKLRLLPKHASEPGPAHLVQAFEAGWSHAQRVP